MHAYNCTVNESTGHTPYLLMFGREARLPVDVAFGVSSDSKAEKKNEGSKKCYDQRVRFCPLLSGDRNLGLQGKNKLADRWKDTPYLVESQMPDLPVFGLKPEIGNGPEKVLHRNHILPIGQEVNLQPEKCKEALKPKRRSSKPLKAKTTDNCDPCCLKTPKQNGKTESVSDSEDDEVGIWYDYHQPQVSQEPGPAMMSSQSLPVLIWA